MARDRQSSPRIPAKFFVTRPVAGARQDGKLLAGHLWTGEHMTVIGCFRRPTAYLAGDLGWSVKRTKAALTSLIETGFVFRDEATGWTLIPSYVELNPIHNAQAAVGAVAVFAEIPENCPVQDRVIETLRPFRERLKPAVEAFKARKAAQRAAAQALTDPATHLES
jgi:hypothetical protein